MGDEGYRELRIIHVDMDAFFAAVEQRDHPELRGRPVVVGGSPESRGVVSTASYEARRHGIHSAMPAARARSLCPGAVFLPVDMKKYQAVSRQVRAIFARFSDRIEPLSIDEAFLDVTGQDARAAGRAIKESIRRELRLTASVGVSYNKFLAKLGSDLEKPDGFTVITRQRAAELLPGLPVRRLWGIGPRTEEILRQYGVETVTQLRQAEPALLRQVFGRRAETVLQLAHGEDDRQVEAGHEVKSISEETTFSRDTRNPQALAATLRQFAIELDRRAEAAGLGFRTVVLKVRYPDFMTVTRQVTWPVPGFGARAIYQAALRLTREVEVPPRSVRLIGLGLHNLVPRDTPVQLSFPFAGYGGPTVHGFPTVLRKTKGKTEREPYRVRKPLAEE